MKIISRKLKRIITKLLDNKKNIMIAILGISLLVFVLIESLTPSIQVQEESVEDTQLTENTDNHRIDITYTYKKLDDNAYKIYPAHVSHLSDKNSEFYMEYLKSELKTDGVIMVYTDQKYEESESVSEIVQIPCSKDMIIDIDGVTKDITFAVFINKWNEIRQLCLDNPEETSNHIINFVVENQEIKKISINSFDLTQQDIEMDYQQEFTDVPVI